MPNASSSKRSNTIDESHHIDITRITIVGAGRVGAPTAAVLATHHRRIKFTLVDHSSDVVRRWRVGQPPFYEPGLTELLESTQNLSFSTQCLQAVATADVVMICIPLPGSYKHIVQQLSPILSKIRERSVVVIRSTVQVGTMEHLRKYLDLYGTRSGPVWLVSNPEFLSAGQSINFLQRPDRVVLGQAEKNGVDPGTKTLHNLYRAWVPAELIHVTDYGTAELVKLSANIMRAQLMISMNALHDLADKIGVNAAELERLVKSDQRLGGYAQTLRTGVGGPCLPHDMETMTALAGNLGLSELEMYWISMSNLNINHQTRLLQDLLRDLQNNLSAGSTVAVIGYAFKPFTDEIRHSCSKQSRTFTTRLVQMLLEQSFRVTIFDPLCEETNILEDIERGLSCTLSQTKQIMVYPTATLAAKEASAIIVSHGHAVEQYKPPID